MIQKNFFIIYFKNFQLGFLSEYWYSLNIIIKANFWILFVNKFLFLDVIFYEHNLNLINKI
jgi:hypothetical protein